MERRYFGATEVRTLEPAADGQPRRLMGYAAVFNSPAHFRRFSERIAPGAFAKSLAEDDVVALWNHNPDFPLGRRSAGTLRLAEDERGLRFEVDVPDTTAGRDLLVSVARGDVRGVSFGFEVRGVAGDSWAMVDGKRTRTLHDVILADVSPVTQPAYEQTSLEARSLDALAAEAERRLPTEFVVGDRVQVREGKHHDPMTKRAIGKIVEISSPALGIKFDGMPGTHRWYTQDELEPADPAAAMEMDRAMPLGHFERRTRLAEVD